jgi:hypothetical protein
MVQREESANNSWTAEEASAAGLSASLNHFSDATSSTQVDALAEVAAVNLLSSVEFISTDATNQPFAVHSKEEASQTASSATSIVLHVEKLIEEFEEDLGSFLKDVQLASASNRQMRVHHGHLVNEYREIQSELNRLVTAFDIPSLCKSSLQPQLLDAFPKLRYVHNGDYLMGIKRQNHEIQKAVETLNNYSKFLNMDLVKAKRLATVVPQHEDRKTKLKILEEEGQADKIVRDMIQKSMAKCQDIVNRCEEQISSLRDEIDCEMKAKCSFEETGQALEVRYNNRECQKRSLLEQNAAFIAELNSLRTSNFFHQRCCSLPVFLMLTVRGCLDQDVLYHHKHNLELMAYSCALDATKTL